MQEGMVVEKGGKYGQQALRAMALLLLGMNLREISDVTRRNYIDVTRISGGYKVPPQDFVDDVVKLFGGKAQAEDLFTPEVLAKVREAA